MLFLVDGNGVPSVASFLRVGDTPDADGDGLSNGDETGTFGTNPLAADSDQDSLSDGDEILVHSTNPLRPDSDGDELEEGEEVNIHGTNPLAADTDTDLVWDGPEVVCASQPLDPLIRPERVDGAFAGIDDDGDLSIDEPLPPGAGGSDCDGDGFDGSTEEYVYSLSGMGDQDSCGGSSVPTDPSGWPDDFISAGLSLNRVTLVDLTSFLAPVRRLDSSPGDLGFNRRWDLVPGPGLYLTWIALNDLTALLAGPTGYPPMLAGARAFGGPFCPWLP
jgi:hypothetical protein